MAHELLKKIETGNKSSLLKKRIINYYIYNGNSTISELARALDISIPTATKLVEDMSADGFINTYGKLETSEGRHPNLYGLNPDSGYFIGVDINQHSINIGLINFNGEMMDTQMHVPYKLDNTPEGLEELCRLIKQFANETNIDQSKIINVNVNISGRVNPQSGYSYSWFNFKEDPLSQTIGEKIGFNVTIDNDSRAMAYGEYLNGTFASKKDVLFINVSWGLGLGIIINGQIYSGYSGFAGEMGHYPCYDNEVICHCGKKGCLETEASGNAIHRKLVDRVRAGESSILSERILDGGPAAVTLTDIIQAVISEDVLCIDLVEELGAKLGRHVAGLINLFNPEEVIVGGLLSLTGDYILQPLRASIRKHSLNMVNRTTKVSMSHLKDKAGLVGACMLARSRIFENPRT